MKSNCFRRMGPHKIKHWSSDRIFWKQLQFLPAPCLPTTTFPSLLICFFSFRRLLHFQHPLSAHALSLLGGPFTFTLYTNCARVYLKTNCDPCYQVDQRLLVWCAPEFWRVQRPHKKLTIRGETRLIKSGTKRCSVKAS